MGLSSFTQASTSLSKSFIVTGISLSSSVAFLKTNTKLQRDIFNRHYKPQTLLFLYFHKSLLRLIGMVGKTCLPSNAYFLWTPDYTPFILGPCLSVYLKALLILSLCILTLWFFQIPFWYVDHFGIWLQTLYFCIQNNWKQLKIPSLEPSYNNYSLTLSRAINKWCRCQSWSPYNSNNSPDNWSSLYFSCRMSWTMWFK